jgi:two-component system response regulator
MKTIKTILQVEDDPNDVFFLQRAMKKAEVTNPIQVASDGQEAIDYLKGTGKFMDRDQFPFPYLVLLDLKLPYVMGLDVLRWIRQQPGLPPVVIILSASGQEGDIATAYRLGANAFLVKPSDASKLENMVKAIRAFWLTHNTPPQESYLESTEVPRSRQICPVAKDSPATIDTRYEEWRPMMTKQTCRQELIVL